MYIHKYIYICIYSNIQMCHDRNYGRLMYCPTKPFIANHVISRRCSTIAWAGKQNGISACSCAISFPIRFNMDFSLLGLSLLRKDAARSCLVREWCCLFAVVPWMKPSSIFKWNSNVQTWWRKWFKQIQFEYILWVGSMLLIFPKKLKIRILMIHGFYAPWLKVRCFLLACPNCQ